jgi:hypothetical protein
MAKDRLVTTGTGAIVLGVMIEIVVGAVVPKVKGFFVGDTVVRIGVLVGETVVTVGVENQDPYRKAILP